MLLPYNGSAKTQNGFKIKKLTEFSVSSAEREGFEPPDL